MAFGEDGEVGGGSGEAEREEGGGSDGGESEDGVQKVRQHLLAAAGAAARARSDGGASCVSWLGEG